MRLYLSSSHLGNSPHDHTLISLFEGKRHVAIISNARDYLPAPQRQKRQQTQMDELEEIGIESTELNLRDFSDPEALKKELKKFNGLWIIGGNAFLLRRAMRDSGFDLIIKDLLADNTFVYAGYSAGIVVIGKTMKGLDIADDLKAVHRIYDKQIVWKGLDLVPYSIAPHYQSNHKESAAVDKVVEYFVEHDIEYKTIKDGQAIVITEDGERLLA